LEIGNGAKIKCMHGMQLKGEGRGPKHGQSSEIGKLKLIRGSKVKYFSSK